MRLLIFLIIISLGIFTCSDFEQHLEIGDLLPPHAVKIGKNILVTPGLFLRAFGVHVNDEIFLACPDQNDSVVFIQPASNDFKTPEGVKVGDIYFSILRVVPDSTRIVQGWAYVLPLLSGWNAAFCEGEHKTDGLLQDDSEVVFLFKSKYVR